MRLGGGFIVRTDVLCVQTYNIMPTSGLGLSYPLKDVLLCLCGTIVCGRAAEETGCRHFSVDVISVAVMHLQSPHYSPSLTSHAPPPYSACIANLSCMIRVSDIPHALLDVLP